MLKIKTLINIYIILKFLMPLKKKYFFFKLVGPRLSGDEDE